MVVIIIAAAAAFYVTAFLERAPCRTRFTKQAYGTSSSVVIRWTTSDEEEKNDDLDQFRGRGLTGEDDFRGLGLRLL